MGERERFPKSLNAVNIVCFRIDWHERMLNVLLTKRDIAPYKNKWSLPGGFVQADETIEEAAKRIFITETGLTPNYLSQFRTYSDSKRDQRVIDEKTGERIPFFNLGPKNNWKKSLDSKIRYRLEKAFKKEMEELGYS